MNKKFAVGLSAAIVSTALFLAGCTAKTPATPPEDQAPGQAIEKSGDTSLTGKLVKLGEKHYLQLNGKPNQEVDSYSVNLSAYEGKTVTITGQFSGDTLFAGKIEAQ